MANPIKVSKLDLQNEVAVILVREGAAVPPVDFRDLNNPLRIEIEALLAKVAVGTSKAQRKKAKRKERNQDRSATVEAYLAQNYPGNKKLKDTIMGDLMSYGGWEDEVTEDEDA